MSAAHSPGPWTILPGVYDTNPETASEFPHGPEIQAGSHGIIASLPMYGELNAALIAAAPDMLAALKGVLDPDEANDSGLRPEWKAVADAIAKAEGRP